MTETNSGAIASYYDNLVRFLDFARRVGRGGGAQQGSTHRFLAGLPDESERDTPGPERLDWLVLHAALANSVAQNPRVLDAGCGLGGTIFHWKERLGGRYDGLTLSAEQKRRADAQAARRGVADECQFHVRSYHEALDGPYDVVIAIESLAHSPEPGAAINTLAQGLAPGGLMLIVDDMPEGTDAPRLLKGFKAGWQCPVLQSAAQARAAMSAAGLNIVQDTDLTARLRPRGLAWLKVLIAAFGFAHAIAPTRAARDVLGALRGGFYLEALYRVNAMRYRLIVGRAKL